MNYSEEKNVSKIYKQEYLDSLIDLIHTQNRRLSLKRKDYFTRAFKDAEKYRKDLSDMLGWPLTESEGENRDIPVSATELFKQDGHTVYRMQFTLLENIKISGLFFRADGADKKPLVIVQHGGNGTPEFIAGFYGDTGNYHNMLARTIAHGVHAFAPQLLLWEEGYEVSFNRAEIDAQLKRVGSSITAIEIYAIKRILDYFEKQPYVSTFGMIGLSYGGFYTLLTAALETRIKAAVSCSFFASREAYPWEDWTWFHAAEIFDDAEIACLCYPRKLCIRMGTVDDLFDYTHSVKSFEQIQEYCAEVGTDWLDFATFEGTHEMFKDDKPIEDLIKNLQK